ncbi:MAG TPA: HD domain-containing protein [Acidimicrobiia bacterium]|nr:HD domain-containing protein [Acidimicrobiia bacterium]
MDANPLDWALFVAEEHLAGPLPGRWLHGQAVIAKARAVAGALRLTPAERDLLVAAAALHDIGLAPDIAATKASFLDGARWLAEQAAPTRLVDLVAHCDCGQVEAALQGHEAEYAQYTDERSPTRDALWYCCLTTGADGTPVSVQERIAAWATTYADDDVITRYAILARDELLAAVARTEARLNPNA